MQSPPQAFDRRRHVIVPSLVGGPLLGFLWRYIIERADAGRLRDDEQVRGRRSVYADPVMEHLLERVRPAIETATDLRLFPTYSYVRVYEHGDALARHADRPSCEISVSVNLGQEPSAPWPLWIAGPAGHTVVDLSPGDALVYRGIECEHWREPFEGARLAQVFLHYVDAAGPHREWRFDKRDSLDLSLRLPI